MKKTLEIICSVILISLLTGCAPRVITDFPETYPVITSADSVCVYEQDDSIPALTRIFGRVSVVDAGLTTKCNFDQVLALAKKEVAAAGGNGYMITNHLYPSLWGSSCHQVSGLALRTIADSAVYMIPNPVVEVMNANRENKVEVREKKEVPRFALSAYWGGGFIISKILTPFGKADSKASMEWGAELEHIYNKGAGYSIQYSGAQSSFFSGYTMLQTYIAPSAIYKCRSDNWLFKFGIGVGYFNIKESFERQRLYSSGFGVNCDFAAECMLTKHLGLGISLGMLKGILPGGNTGDLKPDELPGIMRIKALIGIHYNF